MGQTNELKIFNFQNRDVRVIDRGGEPWFVAKDVAEVLGYSETNRMTARLDGDEKSKIKSTVLAGLKNVGNNDVTIINESGLYNAVLGSAKPEAKTFKRWVTSEVLPTIRRCGAYVMATGSESPEELYLRALTALKDALDRQKRISDEQEAQLRNQAPDVEYCKRVLAADNLHTINAIAVHLGVSAVKLNKFLSAEGWIYRRGSIWYPAAKLRERSLCDFHVVPYINSRGERVTREHLKWTESGRRAVIDLWHRKHN